MAKAVKKAVRKKGGSPFDADAFLRTVGPGRVVARYRKDQKLFSQGEDANTVYFIQEGRVKITVVSEAGKEAVVAILDKDGFCGEGCLTGQPKRMATARAMTECVITRIDKNALIRTLSAQPSLSASLMEYLLKRTIRVEEDLIDQLFNSSEKRLARALLLLANFGKEGRPERLIADISQETLAEMIGTTRPRVNYFMNKFRKLGFISYNGTMKIHSALLSVVLNERPPHIKSDVSQRD